MIGWSSSSVVCLFVVRLWLMGTSLRKRRSCQYGLVPDGCWAGDGVCSESSNAGSRLPGGITRARSLLLASRGGWIHTEYRYFDFPT